MTSVWEAVKEVIKDEIPASTFHLWIEPLQVENGPEGKLLLACPNPFSLRWVQGHYLPLIRQAMENLGQTPVAVALKLLDAPTRPQALPRPTQPALPQIAPPTPRSSLQPPGLSGFPCPGQE
jgi:chromosomal replication initiator protein